MVDTVGLQAEGVIEDHEVEPTPLRQSSELDGVGRLEQSLRLSTGQAPRGRVAAGSIDVHSEVEMPGIGPAHVHRCSNPTEPLDISEPVDIPEPLDIPEIAFIP